MKIIIRRLFLLLGSVCLAIFLLEGALQLFTKDTTKNLDNIGYTFSCYEKGDYYWYKLKTNQTCQLKSRSHAFPDFLIRTNSLSLRNPEISQKKNPKTVRVLFVGDSYTFGMGVEENEAFPRKTQELFNQQFATTSASLESINAGLPAADAGYYYLYLKNDGEKLKPDIVVIGFYTFNDIYDDEFKLTWTETDPNGLPAKITAPLSTIDSTGRVISTNIAPKYKMPWIRKSRILTLLTDSLFETTKVRNETTLLSNVCLYKPSCHDLDENKAKTKQLFDGIKKMTDANHQKLLVVMIPAIWQVYDKYRIKYNILVPLSPTEKSLPHTEFASFFQSRNIDYIDMLPIFLKKPQQTYFTEDTHWNTFGHEIAAEAIVEKLKNYDLK